MAKQLSRECQEQSVTHRTDNEHLQLIGMQVPVVPSRPVPEDKTRWPKETPAVQQVPTHEPSKLAPVEPTQIRTPADLGRHELLARHVKPKAVLESDIPLRQLLVQDGRRLESVSSKGSQLGHQLHTAQIPTQQPKLTVLDKPQERHIRPHEKTSTETESGVKTSDTTFKMDFRCPVATYLTFILLSLTLYIAELALHAVVIVYVYNTANTAWFIVIVVLYCLPSILVQLVSFQWGFNSTECVSQVLVAFLHVLQLAVPWRYLRLICSSHVSKVDKELLQVAKLRLLQSFTSSMPIVVFEVYMILKAPNFISHPELLAAAIVGWVAVVWTLCTHRKREKEYAYLGTMVSWPATCLKLIWRLGEVGVRILLLALCIRLETYWIFLVLGLHWITMLAWLLLEHWVRYDAGATLQSVAEAIMTSFIYITAYKNISHSVSLRYKPILFYLIMFLENVVLLILWIIYDYDVGFHIPIAVVIGIAYVFALISVVLYYNCFHTKSPNSFRPESDTSYIQTCVNCKISCCVENNIKMEKPFNGHWWMEVKAKSSNATSDCSDTGAPSEFSSVSKQMTATEVTTAGGPRRPVHGGRINHAYYSADGYFDDTFSSTVYTDSQYMSEYTVDSYYDTASDLPWDVYGGDRRRAPDTLAPKTKDQTGLVHQRSDSGFSASASLQSDPNHSRQLTDLYTTDDSDVSNGHHRNHARMIGKWRHHILQNTVASGDASESDFFSQSSVASYPSSMPSRTAVSHARERQLRSANGVARRIDRSRHGSWSTTSQSTLGPLGLPTNRHRRHRHTHNQSSFVLDDKLEQIIMEVCNIEKKLKKEKPNAQRNYHHRERADRFSDSDSTQMSPRQSHTPDPHQPVKTHKVPGRRAYTPDAILDAALLLWTRPRTPDRLSVSSMVGVKPASSKDSLYSGSIPNDSPKDNSKSKDCNTTQTDLSKPNDISLSEKCNALEFSESSESKTDLKSVQQEATESLAITLTAVNNKTATEGIPKPGESTTIQQHKKLLQEHRQQFNSHCSSHDDTTNTNNNNIFELKELPQRNLLKLPFQKCHVNVSDTMEQLPTAVWF